MKFNKDTLVKHRFWAMLAVSVPLTIAGVALLMTVVSSQINKDRESLTALAKELSNLPATIHGPQTIQVMGDKAKEIGGQESVVWGDAFKAQEPLYRWADEMEQRFEFQGGRFANDIQVGKMVADRKEWPADKEQPKDDVNVMLGTVENVNKDELILRDRDNKLVKFYRTAKVNVAINEEAGKKSVFFASLLDQKGQLLTVSYQRSKYFNDPLTDSEQTEFGRSYLGQIPGLVDSVDPLHEIKADNGDMVLAGVVQFPGYFHKKEGRPEASSKFLKFVDQPWKDANDISEEAWLAQEDIWVQREIYRLIREANDSIGRFKGAGGEEKNKTYAFENSYFKVELTWPGETKLLVKVTNLLDRRQKLDLSFRVKTNKALVQAFETFKIDGEPLDPKASFSKEVTLEKGLRRTGIHGLEQVLTWETAAIKRIDQVSVGEDFSHSQRTFPDGIRPLVEVKDDKKEDKKDPGGKPAEGLGPVGVGIGMAGGLGGQAANGRRQLPNGFVRERYAEVSQQSRRIPVAVSLIVDQNHVDRVLTTFNNSKLRFLVSQALLNHYPGSMRPQIVPKDGAGENKGGGLGMPPAFGPPPGMFGGGGRPGEGPLAPGGGFGGGFGGAIPSAGGSADLEANMELVLYGMVTLYERFPPRPAQAAAPADAK